MMTPQKTQQVFDALELEELPPDEQEEVLLTMGELIFKDTLIRCLEGMSEKDREQLGKLTDSGATPDDIASFVVAHVPDADARAAAAVDSLADDILAVTDH